MAPSSPESNSAAGSASTAGVYATFTGPMTRDAQLWAAVLAAGPGAQLSHETAAEINRLTDRPSPFIHVTIPANRRITPPKA